jgi:predicted ATP-grasp superfamily ATP-dependent carboligase
MGDIADSMIDGEFDYISGEYIGPGVGYPRTYSGTSSKRVKVIRKELTILIKEKHSHCTTQAEKNKAVTDARAEMNVKYGHGWREN